MQQRLLYFMQHAIACKWTSPVRSASMHASDTPPLKHATSMGPLDTTNYLTYEQGHLRMHVFTHMSLQHACRNKGARAIAAKRLLSK